MLGIQTRTNDNFLHSNPQLRIGGELQGSDGQRFEFIRRKGIKETLLTYGDNGPFDKNRFTQFLPAGIDETLFTKLWGIDHDRLIAGGRELLEQSGDLGRALFSAADLFKPRSSKSLLNKAVFDYKEAQKKMHDASLPASNWKALQKELLTAMGRSGLSTPRHNPQQNMKVI